MCDGRSKINNNIINSIWIFLKTIFIITAMCARGNYKYNFQTCSIDHKKIVELPSVYTL